MALPPRPSSSFHGTPGQPRTVSMQEPPKARQRPGEQGLPTLSEKQRPRIQRCSRAAGLRKVTLVTHPRIIDVDARVPIRPITDNPSHVSLTPVGILIIPPFTRISHGPVAHHPRIDVEGQHDREELNRPACELASKPSQLIPAEPWPLGFNAGIAEHAVELTRTRTAGRGMGHQQTRQALCRRSSSHALPDNRRMARQ
jgi:hypothetical protein